MKLNALAAAALAAACLAAPALAADPPSTALPLGTPNGTTFNEATYFDGSYFFPKSLLHGWTGSAIKPLSLDANGFPSVHVLDSVLPTGGATSGLQTTGNGFLQTLAGAVSGGVLQTACTSGCSGGGGGSGGAVTQSGTWTVNLGTLNGAATAAGQASLLTALGTPLQAGGAVTVSNLPATQAVSAASLPLPTGAATSAKQDALLTALGTPLQAGGAVTVTGGPTATAQATANTSLANILAALQATLTTRTAPFTTATPLTPGTPVTAGRALFLACTAAGTVRIKLSSGNTLDVPVYVGSNELSPYAVTDIVAANTTATCVASVLGG